MLELGRAGEHGTGTGVVPVLAEGKVVATLHTHRVLAAGRQVAAAGTAGTWSTRPTPTAAPQDHQVVLPWPVVGIGRRRATTAMTATVAGASS